MIKYTYVCACLLFCRLIAISHSVRRYRMFHRNRVVDATLEFDEVKILLRVIFFLLVNIKFPIFCNHDK